MLEVKWGLYEKDVQIWTSYIQQRGFFNDGKFMLVSSHVI
jgi:hypothetical protein